MNLFDLTLRLSGFPLRDAQRRLQDIQEIPETDFEAYVKGQRATILDYHLVNNRTYRDFVDHRVFDDWNDVPVMQKKDLQKPLTERLSTGFTPKNVYVNKTSGSSGHPFIFAKDKFCHALTWAEIYDRFGWYGLDFNKSLQARFYGIPLDAKGYRKERIKDWLSHRYRFPIFNLSDAKLEQFLAVFRRKKFDYINGYTSSIVLFAKFLKRKDLTLTEVCPTLKYCIVTSEMLFESDKQLMQEVLGVPVINEYGASELDLIAFENKQGEFVVNSETLFVEILDDENKPVPNGQPGRVVITSLYNKAHPMIRYEIGDTGIFSPASTYKKPVLQELIGRTNDVATLPSGKTVPGLTFYYVTKSIIEDDGNVSEFVIEQHAVDSFKILYASGRELTSEEIQVMENALWKYLEPNLKLTFERVAVLDRSKRGKLKQFTSLIPS